MAPANPAMTRGSDQPQSATTISAPTSRPTATATMRVPSGSMAAGAAERDSGIVNAAPNSNTATAAMHAPRSASSPSPSPSPSPSKVSRPTVYAHFDSREELIELAVTHISAGLFQHIVDEASHASTAADFVVEATIAGARLLRETQQTALSAAESAGAEWLATLMTPESLRLARHYLEPIRHYEPDHELDLDEIAETTVRFLVSILQFDTPATSDSDRVRAYLHRRLVPALGLSSRP
jgi:AcrR family transcriptional regulator